MHLAGTYTAPMHAVSGDSRVCPAGSATCRTDILSPARRAGTPDHACEPPPSYPQSSSPDGTLPCLVPSQPGVLQPAWAAPHACCLLIGEWARHNPVHAAHPPASRSSRCIGMARRGARRRAPPQPASPAACRWAAALACWPACGDICSSEFAAPDAGTAWQARQRQYCTRAWPSRSPKAAGCRLQLGMLHTMA